MQGQVQIVFEAGPPQEEVQKGQPRQQQQQQWGRQQRRHRRWHIRLFRGILDLQLLLLHSHGRSGGL